MRAVVAVMLVSGCSNKLSSIDADRSMASLSPDEMTRFCHDYDAWLTKYKLEAHRGWHCALDALDPDNYKSPASSDVDAQSRCRDFRDRCEIKLKANEPKPLDCVELAKEMSSCPTLTVGEIEACQREDLERTSQHLETDPCLVTHKGFDNADYMKWLRSDSAGTGPACRQENTKCSK